MQLPSLLSCLYSLYWTDISHPVFNNLFYSNIYISYNSLDILSSHEVESDDISNTTILASLLMPTSSRSGNFKNKQ